MNQCRSEEAGQNQKGHEGRRQFLRSCGGILSGITIVGMISPVISGCDTTLEPRPETDGTNTGGNGNSGGNNNGGNNNGGNNGGNGGLTFDVSGLTTDGAGMITTVKGPDSFPILIVRVAEGKFNAMTTKCTHQGCEVNPPDPALGYIGCPCHGSRYAFTGAVIKGPAPSPLKRYTTAYDAGSGILTVTT